MSEAKARQNWRLCPRVQKRSLRGVNEHFKPVFNAVFASAIVTQQPAVVCVCLAISSTYELIEWLTAVAVGSAADEFLGSQGDVWDTQQDIAWALVGAITSQLIFGNVHNHQL